MREREKIIIGNSEFCNENPKKFLSKFFIIVVPIMWNKRKLSTKKKKEGKRKKFINEYLNFGFKKNKKKP